jgi:hypothetical protein
MLKNSEDLAAYFRVSMQLGSEFWRLNVEMFQSVSVLPIELCMMALDPPAERAERFVEVSQMAKHVGAFPAFGRD